VERLGRTKAVMIDDSSEAALMPRNADVQDIDSQDMDSRDISFSVPMTHRLRFTEDVTGNDFAELRAVLHAQVGLPTRVLIWADEDVAALSNRVAKLESKLASCEGIELVAPTTCFPGGEGVKNSPAVVESMLDQINEFNLDRRSYVIAIGGGAVLDVAGFAAAIAHRGIRLIRIPTTTLAQADSGVGVKNAVNRYGKKNWIGTFVAPWAVINDTALLSTLPGREFCCGFSEAVKVSLLKSESMFSQICADAKKIAARDMGVAKRVIAESCKMHLRHITDGGDPFETRESRPLDFGHWSAHRLEPMTHYRIRHGEAVGIGVALDCIYSSLKHGLPWASAEKAHRCLQQIGMPLWDDAMDDFDRLLIGLEEFRQHLGGRLTVTMLRGVGDPIDVHEIDTQAMREAAKRLRSLSLGAV
jgi:3-dehydroquinate synthase